jgi:hypothetical protein
MRGSAHNQSLGQPGTWGIIDEWIEAASGNHR